MNNNEFNCDPKSFRSSDDFLPGPKAKEGSAQAKLESLIMSVSDMEQQSRIDEAIEALEEAVTIVYEVDAVRPPRGSEPSMNSISAGSAWTFVEKLGFHYERQERYEEAKELYETFLPGLIEAEAGNLTFIAKAIFPLVRTLAQLSDLNNESRLVVENEFALLFAGICFSAMEPRPRIIPSDHDPIMYLDHRAQELASYLNEKLRISDILTRSDRIGLIMHEPQALMELWLKLCKWSSEAFAQEELGTACELIESAYKLLPSLIIEVVDQLECINFYARICKETDDSQMAKKLVETACQILAKLGLDAEEHMEYLNSYAEFCQEIGCDETAEKLFAQADDLMQNIIDAEVDAEMAYADAAHMEAPDFEDGEYADEFLAESLFDDPMFDEEMPEGFALDEPQDSDNN
jgi:tetratricopeptide (TPR) repeat protein